MSENPKPDIVERLRSRVSIADREEAAAEIERLRAVVAREYVTIDFSQGYDSSFLIPPESYTTPRPPADVRHGAPPSAWVTVAGILSACITLAVVLGLAAVRLWVNP